MTLLCSVIAKARLAATLHWLRVSQAKVSKESEA